MFLLLITHTSLILNFLSQIIPLLQNFSVNTNKYIKVKCNVNNICGNRVVHYSKNIIETTHNTGTTTIMQLTNRDKDCDCAKCPYEMNEVEVKRIVENLVDQSMINVQCDR